MPHDAGQVQAVILVSRQVISGDGWTCIKDCREEEECSVALQTACPQGWFCSISMPFSDSKRFYPCGSGQAGLSPMGCIPQTGQVPG